MDPAREQALEATAILVQEGGSCRLTLERVAEAAELPLDVVRENFATVTDLVRAVGERGFETHLKRIAEAVGEDDDPGAFVRGYIEGSFPSDRETDNFVGIVTSLLMSAPLETDTFEAVRARQKELDAALSSDGLDPTLARIVRFAVDGLYMNDVFGMTALSEADRAALLDRLSAMTRADGEASPTHHGPAGARHPG